MNLHPASAFKKSTARSVFLDATTHDLPYDMLAAQLDRGDCARCPNMLSKVAA